MANSKLKCRGCDEFFPRETMVSFDWGRSHFHDRECANQHSRKPAQQAKGKKIIDKAFDKETTRKTKEFNRKDIRWQHKQTQPAFNRMRVLEELKWFSDNGIEPYCISCLKTGMDWCCGHYKTVGAQGVLRYDPKNTMLQCNRYCNMGLSGNISGTRTTVGYTKGLVHRLGEDEALWVLDYLDITTETKKWTPDELELIRSNANKRIRELEAQQ